MCAVAGEGGDRDCGDRKGVEWNGKGERASSSRSQPGIGNSKSLDERASSFEVAAGNRQLEVVR